MSSLALLSINVFGADRKSATIAAIFSATIMACILMNEDDDA